MGHKHSAHKPHQWKINIEVEQVDDRTHAVAHLTWKDHKLKGVGDTRLESGDHFPDKVGEKLAVARALSDVTRQLFTDTADDIEVATGTEVSVR